MTMLYNGIKDNSNENRRDGTPNRLTLMSYDIAENNRPIPGASHNTIRRFRTIK
jgi:hypothetical protein